MVYAMSKRVSRSLLQLADWPAVDDRVFDEEAKASYRLRYKAVQAYARGDTLEQIEATGIHRATVLRMVARAQRPHPDGRLWGWRALQPHVRVQSYERIKPPKVLAYRAGGNSGAFHQLLLRHPSLATQLRGEITGGAVQLKASGERGRLTGTLGASQRFLQTCRDLGLGAGDYPLNQKDKAVRSLARTLRSWTDEDFDLAAAAAGTRIKPASALRQLPARSALDALDTVEFDAHKMDLRLKVIDRDPLGGEQSLEIERVWLLAIIDVATRCILGWQLSLKRECNRFDVIETVKRALAPTCRPTLTLPGLQLLPSGGYVSQALEATRHAVWRQIRLDNARAHLATTSLDVLCDSLGCTADFGPAYQPDDRPFIERFFGTVTATLSRRLPGALPGRPAAKTLLHRLRDPKDNLRLLVTVQELDELLAMQVWNYHGTPHAGLGGLTPLEMMRRHVMGIGRDPVRLTRVPVPLRLHPSLLHDPILCAVHGNLARGERPYISFMHVRYTCGQLARRSGLVGKKLRVHFDPADLRELTATTEDGEILEPLLASGPWRYEPHSLWLRQQFFKAKRERQLTFVAGDNPVEAFLKLRRQQVPKRKRAASDIAQVQRDRSRPGKPAATAPPSDASADAPGPLAQLSTGPVKGKHLRITRGFSR